MSNKKRIITMYVSPVVAVLLLIGLLASEGRGDFTLWDDDQLTVNTSHSVGTLFDESRASIVTGGWVNNLYAHNSSTVDMSGGSVGILNAYDNTVDMSGGSVSRFNAYGSSIVEISGGSISSGFYAYETSTTTFIARDFRLGAMLSIVGDRVLGTGFLSGEWYDGTRWAAYIATNDSGATILLASGPGTQPEPPVAEADGPYSVWAGDPLILNASGSTDSDGQIVSYMWDLDNSGSFETNAGNQPFFAVDYERVQDLGLAVGGMYDIHLKVTDSTGLFDTDSSSLRVTPEPATLTLLTLSSLALVRRRKRGMCK